MQFLLLVNFVPRKMFKKIVNYVKFVFFFNCIICQKHVDFLYCFRHVTRVADVKEDDLEALYEKRLRKTSVVKENEDKGLQLDPVDALPVKTLDGKLYYRTSIELFNVSLGYSCFESQMFSVSIVG